MHPKWNNFVRVWRSALVLLWMVGGVCWYSKDVCKFSGKFIESWYDFWAKGIERSGGPCVHSYIPNKIKHRLQFHIVFVGCLIWCNFSSIFKDFSSTIYTFSKQAYSSINHLLGCGNSFDEAIFVIRSLLVSTFLNMKKKVLAWFELQVATHLPVTINYFL